MWATYFHKSSPDAVPRQFCCGIEWCLYKQLYRDGTLNQYRHTHANGHLPTAVMEKVYPVYKDLARTELLRTCVDGYTQNANESVNSVIWKYCPTSKYHGLESVNIAVAIAVLSQIDFVLCVVSFMFCVFSV